MKLDVAIPAGGAVRPDRVAAFGTPYKPLAEVAGRPLLEHTIARLRESASVGRIAVVAGDEVLSQLGHLADVTGADQGSGPRNLAYAIDLLGTTERVIVCGCDAPLVEGHMIDALVRACRVDAWICYSYVSVHAFAVAFPECPSLRVRLWEGSFIGGTVHVARPEAVTRGLPLFEEVFAARKNPLRMVRIMGAGTLLRFATRTLTLRALEARASRVFGYPCMGVEVPYPQLAFDIDRPEHLEIARERLGSGPPNAAPAPEA